VKGKKAQMIQKKSKRNLASRGFVRIFTM